ncbi:DUF6527 family protein [Rhizobium rhizogenes]|uniref:DUF6527 family protein n=1 Tax=Rhizobium rhizogenes TaxID=359 RepID=UPI001572389F|nr:DUF6527 family protein [Rhizobium rhizogenes]NTG08847.1 hypothetical protein [Rhizobium rhizogenes]
MKSSKRLKYSFVEGFPDQLESDTLYISVEHASMAHLCACGCRAEVITPLSPTDWRFTFDGKTVSVDPSVGNWSLACRSHYVIRNNLVHWAGDWSEETIAAGRKLDLARKRGLEVAEPAVSIKLKDSNNADRNKPPVSGYTKVGVMARLWKLFTSER